MKKYFHLFSLFIFASPFLLGFQQHNQSISYTHPAIVVSGDVSYISVQNVPAGTAITSTNYWTPLLNTAPTVDPGDPATTEPGTSDSDLGNLTPPEDNNESNEDTSSGSFIHNQNQSYSHPKIVVSNGVSYISLQDVPAGVAITNTVYWTPLLTTAPTEDPGDPPTTEPDSSDANLSELPLPDDSNDSDNDGIPNSKEIEIGSDPNVSDAAVFNYAMGLGIETGKNLILNDPASYSLVTMKDFNATLAAAEASSAIAVANARQSGVEEGKNLVTNSPATYGLVSEADKTNAVSQATTNGIQSVLSNPSAFNLFTQTDFEDELQTIQSSADANMTPYTYGWFYTPERGWLWTTNSVFPWIYDANTTDWLYFKNGSELPRFYEYYSKKWLNWEEFAPVKRTAVLFSNSGKTVVEKVGSTYHYLDLEGVSSWSVFKVGETWQINTDYHENGKAYSWEGALDEYSFDDFTLSSYEITEEGVYLLHSNNISTFYEIESVEGGIVTCNYGLTGQDPIAKSYFFTDQAKAIEFYQSKL